VKQSARSTSEATIRAAREPWYRAIFTDRHGEFDNGSVVVGLAVMAMIGLSAYDVMKLGHEFKALDLGGGIGALLGGFAAYRWGDRPSPSYGPRPIVSGGRPDYVDDR